MKNTAENYHRLMGQILSFLPNGMMRDYEDDLKLVKTKECFYLSLRENTFKSKIPHWFVDCLRSGCYEVNDDFFDGVFHSLAYKFIEVDAFHEPNSNHKIPYILYKDYDDYINSDKWQRRRANRMAIDNNECKLCFSKAKLHVHHITYDNFGNEPMSELITVCKSCHEKIHGHEIN